MPVAKYSTIVHFRISAMRAEGGMGEMWRARETQLDRDVPLKLLPEGHFYPRLLILCFAILGLSCLLACSPPPADPAPTLDPVVLQLKWKHQFQFAGYYAALEEGYYEELGLAVRLMEAPESIEPAELVLEGKADFGIATSDLVLLRARGDPVVALAAVYQHSPLLLLSLLNDDIDSIHDLVGRKIMIEPHAAELLAYLEFEGIPASEVTLIPHSFNPNSLISGEVDAMSAYSTDEPFLLQEAGVEYRIFSPRAAGIDLYGDTLFTTEAQIRNHPDRVRAFLEASLRGWQYALEHSDEMTDLIYTKYSQRHSREHLIFEATQTQRLILHEVVEIGYMNPGRWRHIVEVYSRLGMISQDFSLRGFLYYPDLSARPTWFYISLLAALGLLGVISLVALRFYNLNTSLRREVAERARTEESLRTLERRYRILVEQAPFPIIITNSVDGVIKYINPQAAMQFEIAQNIAAGKQASELLTNDVGLEELKALLNRQGYVQNSEIELTTSTGRRFWASLSANMTTLEGEPAIFYAIVDVTDRKELAIRLETMAMTDELTQLANRRYFTQRCAEEFSRFRRYQVPLSLLMVDADGFKDINDAFGHEAGDQVLRQVAAIFKNFLREVDIAGRLGGDEFGIALPNTALEDALVLAERLRRSIARQGIAIRDRTIECTISIGVAEITAEMDGIDDLLRTADVALYKSKDRGGNRVAAEAKDLND